MKKRPKILLRGGVTPPSLPYSAPAASGIVNASIPGFALIPMLQHAGQPARCLVKAGDPVQEGMLIGRAEGASSANVHSSIPGTVVEVRSCRGADGRISPAVLIEFGGEFAATGRRREPTDWEKLSRADLLGRIQAAGVVGLGGGLVPTHLKLARPAGRTVDLFIANGMDSEPSLVGDAALMREKSREIAAGIRICQAILGASRVVLAVGDAEEAGIAPAFRALFGEGGGGFEVAVFSSRYPQGHEQLLQAAVTGTTPVPTGNGAGAAVDAGCVVLNVATIHAVYEAVVLGRPMIERVVTVSGSSIRRPRCLKVRVGTPVGELLEECGGLTEAPAKVVLGGPMRGLAVDSLDFPVTKGVSGVITFDHSDARVGPELPCIHCGACVDVCPWDLVPTRLHKLIERGEIGQALSEGLASCTECGCCAFSCPSRIPLVESLRRGKKGGQARHG